jgi:hypothetical protein
MSKSSRSRSPKTSQRKQASSQRERVASWREGLARLKEEGRLLWLLGQGMDAMLTVEEIGAEAPGGDQVAASVAGWVRQALAAELPLYLVSAMEMLPKDKPSQSKAVRSEMAVAGLDTADTLLDGKKLSNVWCPAVWIGSQDWGQIGQVALVIGVGADGKKRVLSVRSGSIREQSVAVELLSDLTHRGLSIERGILVVTAGSRILDEALRQTWGDRALVSHCRREVLNDVASHVVETERVAVSDQMVEAWTLAPVEAAEALRRIVKKLQRSAPDAAERLGRSLEATLVADRLGASSPLKDRLVSVGSLNQALERAHAWGKHGGGLEALLAGLDLWLKRTRRVMGWQQLGQLARAIQEAVKGP